MSLSLGLGLSITRNAYGPGGGAAALQFAPSAAKILNRNSPGARATVSDYAGSTVILTEYSGASTITGGTGNGQVDEEDMPVGWSGGPRQSPMIISPQTDPSPPNTTYAPGNSVLFTYTGQVFELKTGLSSTAGSLAFRWSEDNGTTWEQIYFAGPSDSQNWIQLDFGSAASRVVEVICCDQNYTPNGFNFDTGPTAPPGFTDENMPNYVMFGDSYVFGQNADDTGSGTSSAVNNQLAIYGQTRKLGEHLGSLQARNHGLRGNRFADTQTNRSDFGDRISGGVFGTTYGEAYLDLDQQGTNRDLWVIPSTINDDGPGHDGLRKTGAIKAFQNLRAAHPNMMIMFPVGARAPQFSEGTVWLSDYKEAFAEVFGSTEAEWIENGAYLLDGSRAEGANWTPSGAEGSSPLFGAVGQDSAHPTAAGHDFLAEKYADGAIYMAEQVVISATAQGFGTDVWAAGTPTVGALWTDNGDGSFIKTSASNSSINLISPDIVAGEAYVARVTADPGMTGELRVRLGGGTSESITAAGDHVFVLDDNTNGQLILQGLTFTGTIRGISLHRLT